MKIKTKTFHTKNLSKFTSKVLIPFGLICQYIDEMGIRSGAGIKPTKQHLHGSESWCLANEEKTILIKAVPWQEKNIPLFAEITNLSDGIAILVRNEYLTASDMQVLWNELGDVAYPSQPLLSVYLLGNKSGVSAYYPSPPCDLYAPHLHDDKPFQLIIVGIGLNESCNLLSLPGTNINNVKQRLHEISEDISESDLCCSESKTLREKREDAINHEKIAEILGIMARRASLAPHSEMTL